MAVACCWVERPMDKELVRLIILQWGWIEKGTYRLGM